MSSYSPADESELLRIRETIITAIASDEQLMERLVLKGGNALDIVYKLSERSSLDLDFSMQGDFADQADAADVEKRLFRALRDRFDSIGYEVFDDKFEARPRDRGGPGVVWGGYNAVFKLISSKRYQALGGLPGSLPPSEVLERMRRESQVSGGGSQRTFVIEISKFEHTEGKQRVAVGGFDCYVYTPAMIAIEKLRAICQQSRQYTQRKHPTPRPRDFFDIHTIVTRTSCELTAVDHHELAIAMFDAKEVDLALLDEIATDERRAFHEQQWPSVVDSVRGHLTNQFDFYHEFVGSQAQQLLAAIRSRK